MPPAVIRMTTRDDISSGWSGPTRTVDGDTLAAQLTARCNAYDKQRLVGVRVLLIGAIITAVIGLLIPHPAGVYVVGTVMAAIAFVGVVAEMVHDTRSHTRRGNELTWPDRTLLGITVDAESDVADRLLHVIDHAPRRWWSVAADPWRAEANRIIAEARETTLDTNLIADLDPADHDAYNTRLVGSVHRIVPSAARWIATGPFSDTVVAAMVANPNAELTDDVQHLLLDRGHDVCAALAARDDVPDEVRAVAALHTRFG